MEAPFNMLNGTGYAKAWLLGYAACIEDRTITDNPYPVGCQDNEDWDKGWIRCMQEMGDKAP